jgi:hypothetical protein
MLVDSTHRNSLIPWQKRAAMWEHGFESRWGHHRETSYSGARQQCIDSEYAAAEIAAVYAVIDGLHLDLVDQKGTEHLPYLRRALAEELFDFGEAVPQELLKLGWLEFRDRRVLIESRHLVSQRGAADFLGLNPSAQLIPRPTVQQRVERPVDTFLHEP